MKLSKILFILLILTFTQIANAGRGVAPVSNELYKEECSACHMAYQPGLLPARSWKKMLNNLADHFGENAELDEKDQQIILDYALKNAADFSNYKRSKKIMRSLSTRDTPLRITKVPYIIRKHDELSNRHIRDNPKVKHLSRCEACHTKVEQGSFSEREIKIPGFGRWED